MYTRSEKKKPIEISNTLRQSELARLGGNEQVVVKVLTYKIFTRPCDQAGLDQTPSAAERVNE
jgi:hypothetical protein